MTEQEVAALKALQPRNRCWACDGDGSLSQQLAKGECARAGGYSEQLPLTRPGHPAAVVYYTVDGKEMSFKTVGGLCHVCEGRGVL